MSARENKPSVDDAILAVVSMIRYQNHTGERRFDDYTLRSVLALLLTGDLDDIPMAHAFLTSVDLKHG